ncbi:hypothetical protein acsn021_11290 [Anaerocolumna cellulosilytica]|uniref:Uncharacterized protein n=1 Tax=Anaerocolumna cellulosilytica TaxID=433286 RepID=A0A6S6R2L4_9FIRM|nr:hypothetical protein [Anaerocolumna cellulosilytica]MBB5194616.1 putative membrane protein [Anaerocolumna cellulosilytica]BCJ93560.1 hypothetical protein acsn021_11290 [Anaerocolumna cellulosilytica]
MEKWSNVVNKVFEATVLLVLHILQMATVFWFLLYLVQEFYMESIARIGLSLLILILQRKVILGCSSDT